MMEPTFKAGLIVLAIVVGTLAQILIMLNTGIISNQWFHSTFTPLTFGIVGGIYGGVVGYIVYDLVVKP